MESQTRFKSVRVHILGGALTQSVRALDIDETVKVISEARLHGWYGNDDLIELVLQYGIASDETSRQEISDAVFLRANLAREIWLETLRRFRREVAGLVRSSRLQLPVPRVYSYDFSELATPGLLGLLFLKMQNFNTDELLEHLIEAVVIDARIGGRRPSKDTRQRQIHSRIDTMLPWWLLGEKAVRV